MGTVDKAAGTCSYFHTALFMVLTDKTAVPSYAYVVIIIIKLELC